MIPLARFTLDLQTVEALFVTGVFLGACFTAFLSPFYDAWKRDRDD